KSVVSFQRLRTRRGSRAQTCERSDHRGSRNAAVTGGHFLAQPLFECLEIELPFSDDALRDRARVNRSKGFGEPFVVEAVWTATDGIFRAAIGLLESG